MAVDRKRLPSLGADPAFTFPAPRKASLANGLSVWTLEHRGVPAVTLLLLLPVGSSCDQPARAGLASLTGALLDEGSGERSALEVHDALARIGARFDMDVGVDATALRVTTLARFADRAMSLLAEMAIRPRFERDDFARIRDLRLNRLTQLRDVASAVADRAFAGALYAGHPYGHMPSGTEAAVRTITREEVVAFHRDYYRASDATLIVVGAGAHDEWRENAAKAFEGWSAAARRDTPVAQPSPEAAVLPPDATERLVVVDRPSAAQSELRIGHVAAARSTPDYHALMVLNMVLGGQFASRLNLNLREAKGYTYGARTAFDFRRSRGPFVAQASVQTDATSASIREVLAEIRAIRGDRPVTEDELALAKAALTRGYPRSFETAGQIAHACAQMALHRLPDDSFTQFVPRVMRVDQATVTAVARAHLDPERVSTVIVGDRRAIAPSLAELRLGSPVEIETA